MILHSREGSVAGVIRGTSLATACETFGCRRLRLFEISVLILHSREGSLVGVIRGGSCCFSRVAWTRMFRWLRTRRSRQRLGGSTSVVGFLVGWIVEGWWLVLVVGGRDVRAEEEEVMTTSIS